MRGYKIRFAVTWERLVIRSGPDWGERLINGRINVVNARLLGEMTPGHAGTEAGTVAKSGPGAGLPRARAKAATRRAAAETAVRELHRRS